MSISPGFTSAQIREFVHQYALQPYGQKAVWCDEHGISRRRLRRWRDAVYEGDVDRGLIPREGVAVTTPLPQRTALERARAEDRAAHQVEVDRLAARVRELEQTNEALGKAIGLLHAMSEHEPTEATTSDPSSS